MKKLLVAVLLVAACMVGDRLCDDRIRTATAEDQQLVIDNGGPGTSKTGGWGLSGGQFPYGGTSLYGRNGATYTYTFAGIPEGSYVVQEWHTTYPSRSANVPHEVEHAAGKTVVHVNQQVDGGRWNSLGPFAVGSTRTLKVKITAVGVASTCADAVRLVRREAGGLPATGQTKCYDDAGAEIGCGSPTFPGQDAFYQAGCPMEGRFVDHQDGTVTDTCTGLMWQKATGDTDRDGSIDEADSVSWQGALEYCEGLTFAGHSDWRLPNVVEIESVVDYSRAGLGTDPIFEDAVAEPYRSWYWSSSTIVDYPNAAWSRAADGCPSGLDYCGMQVGWNYKGEHGFVRAVRTAGTFPSTGLDRVIDNGGPGTSSTGGWAVSGGQLPYGTSSLYGRNGATYTYAFSGIPEGECEVYEWHTTYRSRSTVVPCVIEHAAGKTLVGVNQQVGGGRWNLLGSFTVGPTGALKVTITALGTDTTCADAVRVVQEGRSAVRLPASGQTLCYDSGGNVIPCDSAEFPGQDAFYLSGCPIEGRFVDHQDGTVTDTCTGLTWQKDPGTALYTQTEALRYCQGLSLGGQSDWRLPNLRELFSIVDYGRCWPALDPVFQWISGASEGCLSSTTYVETSWCQGVNFNDGGVGHGPKSSSACVRAVRGGL